MQNTLIRYKWLSKTMKCLWLGGTAENSHENTQETKGYVRKWRVFGRQHNFMKCNLPLSMKGKVYNECILPVFNIWIRNLESNESLERKLQSVQKGMERIMIDITWRDRKRTSWIREQTKVEHILTTIKSKKWTWTGHVMRWTDNRRTVTVTEWQPRDGKRRQGRHRTRWRDEIESFVGVTWSRQAADRDEWRRLGVEDFVLQWTERGWY